MKKLFFLFTTLIVASIFLVSCEKEDLESSLSDTVEDIADTRSRSSYGGLKHNGKWFVFDSEKAEEEIWDKLYEQMSEYEDERYNEEKEEEEHYTDPSPILQQFENSYKHRSYRAMYEQRVYQLLSRGAAPKYALEKANHRGATDIDQSFLNQSGVKQVGKEIYYLAPDKSEFKVLNYDVEALNSLIAYGYDGTQNKQNIVPVIGPEGNPPAACNATFTTSIGSNLNVTIDVAAQHGTNATYKVNWGDGTTTVSSDDNQSHKYQTIGVYTIKVTVTDLDEPCTDDKQATINVTNVPPTIDWKEGACTALKVAGNTPLTFQDNGATPGNPLLGTVILSPGSNAIQAIMDYLNNDPDADPNKDLIWNIDGKVTVGLVGEYDINPNCERDINVTVELVVCDDPSAASATLPARSNTCARKYDTGTEEYIYKTDKKVTLRLQTKKKRAWAKVIHWKKKKNGNWAWEKTKLELKMSGPVFRETSPANGGCKCGDNSRNVNAKRYKKNGKKICLVDKIGLPELGVKTGATNWRAEVSVDGSQVFSLSADHGL